MLAIAYSWRLRNSVQNGSQCDDGRRTRTDKRRKKGEVYRRKVHKSKPCSGDPSASAVKKNKRMRKKIAVVPYLAYGHMMPLAQLCLKLAAQSVAVTVVCTPRNIPPMKSFLGDDPRTQTIQFAEIALPAVEGLPPGLENTADLQRAEQIMMLVDAAALMKDPLTQLLRHISPDCVIFDVWMPVFAADIGIPTAFFVACSFAVHASIEYRWSPQLPMPPIFEIFDGAIRHQDWSIDKVSNRAGPVLAALHGCSALIPNTCDVLEKRFLDYTTKTDSKAVLAVGPLLPRLHAEPQPAAAEEEDECAQRCLAWLEKMKNSSSSSSAVAYVAFGSEFVVQREDDIREIALGLEESGVAFLWALRHGRELLPEQFEERVRGRGVVVDEWVPQAQILRHPIVGAFVTHCGWNSVLEGVTAGVPLVTVPMLSHQRFNARVAAAHIKVALEIQRDAHGGLPRRDVCDALKRLVLCSADEDDGEMMKEIVEMKKRVREISSIIRKDVVRPGGSQDENVRRFVDLIPSFTVSP